MKLTPEQVGKLRLPDGIALRLHPGGWVSRTIRDPAEEGDYAMAVLAEAVANGKLPESVLIAAWAAREGKVEWYSLQCGYDTEFARHRTEGDFAKGEADEYGIIIKLGP